MDERAVNTVNQKIIEKFPYLENVTPDVKPLPDSNYKLTYSGQGNTASGHALPVTVIVTAAIDGTIISIAASR